MYLPAADFLLLHSSRFDSLPREQSVEMMANDRELLLWWWRCNEVATGSTFCRACRVPPLMSTVFVYKKRRPQMKKERKNWSGVALTWNSTGLLALCPGHALFVFGTIHTLLFGIPFSFPAFCIIQSVSFLFTWTGKRERSLFNSLGALTDRFPILLNLLVDSFRLMDGLFSPLQPFSMHSIAGYRRIASCASRLLCNAVQHTHAVYPPFYINIRCHPHRVDTSLCVCTHNSYFSTPFWRQIFDSSSWRATTFKFVETASPFKSLWFFQRNKKRWE